MFARLLPLHAPPQHLEHLEALPPETPITKIPQKRLKILDKLAVSMGAKTVGDLQNNKKKLLTLGLLGAAVVGGAVIVMSKKKAKA